MRAGWIEMSPGEIAIARSVLYASLFEFPLTLAELRHALLGLARTEAEILRTYRSSVVLRSIVDHRAGWFFPVGRNAWIDQRRAREQRSVAILDGHRRLLKMICGLPFVRLVALSGSIAALNADREADLDLFVVTRGRRAWSVTVTIVLLAKLARRRRMICVNFVLADTHLAIAQQDVFAANQVIHLRPLTDDGVYGQFLAANPFVADCYPNFQPASSLSAPLRLSKLARAVKRTVEVAMSWPSLAIEWLCRAAYGGHLQRRAASWRSPDQVTLDPDCLKMHTRSHRATVLDRFERVCDEAFSLSLPAGASRGNSSTRAG